MRARSPRGFEAMSAKSPLPGRRLWAQRKPALDILAWPRLFLARATTGRAESIAALGLASAQITVLDLLDRYFEVRQRGSSVRTEVVAGATTFLAMSYIIAVNPAILADAGIPPRRGRLRDLSG